MKRSIDDTVQTPCEYIKLHPTFSTFDTYEFLKLLKCPNKEAAKQETITLLEDMSKFKNLKENVKNFVKLLSKLDFLNDIKADSYWSTLAHASNAQKQVDLYSSSLAQGLQVAQQIITSEVPPETLHFKRRHINTSNSNTENIDNTDTTDTNYSDTYNTDANNSNTPSTSERLLSYWKNFMKQASEDSNNHVYSAIKNNILLVGDGVYPNSKMDISEYNIINDRLNTSRITSYQLHPDLSDFFQNILNAEDWSSLEITTRSQIPDIDFSNDYLRKQLFLLQEVSLAFISFISNSSLIKLHESCYHNYFIHHLCVSIKKYVNYPITFYPGETPLNSITKYLKSKRIIENEREAYKADGIFTYNGIEICINEISGPFQNTHKSKLQFDFHKAMYGCVSVLWDVVQRYKYASMTTLKELDLYFLHCKNDSIQLWGLKYDDDTLIMHRKRKIVLSIDFDEKATTINKLMLLCHTCKVKFEEAIISLNKLQKEHSRSQTALITGSITQDRIVDLRDVVKLKIHKLTENKDMAGLFKLDPISFTEYDDDSYGFFGLIDD